MPEVQTWTREGRPELNRRGMPAPAGPWTDEPDKIHWVDPATDLDCLMSRGPMGAWCGYVAVTEGHPWFAVDYGKCVENCDEDWCYSHSPEGKVEVHGGITYADFCNESTEGPGHGICHVPLDGRPGRVWWFGFDCAHAGDLSPHDAAMAAHHNNAYPWGLGYEVYRDVAYVKAEVESLARQLKAVSA